MSLPDAWVERIFERLTLVYGHQFLSRWDGMALDKVKASWAAELSRFQQNFGAIAFALDNLPPSKQPPTVLEFRALCSSPQAPPPDQMPALPHVQRADEREVLRHQERLRRVRTEHPDCGRWAWAFALQLKDHEEPQSVTPLARAVYLEALAHYRTRRPADREAA